MKPCDNSILSNIECGATSMNDFIQKYGSKINNALAFLERKIGFFTRIYPPIKGKAADPSNNNDVYEEGESIYGDYDNDVKKGWDKIPSFEKKFIVTGIQNNTSTSSVIIDPFYEEERYIYFIHGERPIKGSLVEIIVVPERKDLITGELITFEEKFQFRLGAEAITIGGSQSNIYRQFVLYPEA